MTRYELEEWLKVPQEPPKPPPEPAMPRRAAFGKLVLILFVAPFGVAFLLSLLAEPDWDNRIITTLGIYAVFVFFGIILLAAGGSRIGRKQ